MNPAESKRYPEVVCTGTAREMGLAQGNALAEKIRGSLAALRELEVFRLRQPGLVPFGLYQWYYERRARARLTGPLAREAPDYSARLAGIAEGSGVRLSALYLLNVLEPIMADVSGCVGLGGACSAVAVRGDNSATGEPMIARNFDYLPLIQPFYTLRESRPVGRRRVLEFTVAPLAGTVDGINQSGLCITYNYAFATDRPSTRAIPISVVIAEVLQRCTTVTEAAGWITARPIWGAGLLMLADASGDIASLEVSCTRSALRRPEPGRDWLCHSNAFRTPPMRVVQVPANAVLTDAAPAALRGRRLHQSAEERDQRFETLMTGRRRFGPEELLEVMGDHGPEGVASDYSPCVHGSYWHTTATLQFFPRSRRLRVSFSTACQADFVEVGF